MTRHKGSRKRSGRFTVSRLIVALAVAMSAVAVAGTPVSAAAEKYFVCKYVGTPGVDEVLQTGDNPISVSVNALVGKFFNDEQGRSYVLVEDTGQPKPEVSECPQPEVPTDPVVDPDGSIAVDCTGMGTAHADNSASTTSFGFEVVVNGVATLYSLEAGQVWDIPFSGAQPGSVVILQDGEANELDSAVVPECEPPLECPEGTEWFDDNGNGVVDDGECVVIPVHPDGDVTVTAGCGFITVTNNEDRVMRFEYGSFGSLDGPDVLDGARTVQSGKTVKITTARQSLDWHASWDFGGLVTRGIDLKVRQDCEGKPPAGVTNGSVSNPTHETPFLANTGADGSSSNTPLVPIGLMAALLFGLALLFAPGRKAGAKR